MVKNISAPPDPDNSRRNNRATDLNNAAGTLAGHALRVAHEVPAAKASPQMRAALLSATAESFRRAADLLEAEIIKTLIELPEVRK